MSALQAALDALARGQAVIVPTETVYGLAVDARNPAAVDQLIALKGRPPEKPFSVAVHPDFDVSTLAEVTPLAERLMRAFWPGPLTLVLRARGAWHPSIADRLVTGGPHVRIGVTSSVNACRLVFFDLQSTPKKRSSSSQLSNDRLPARRQYGFF